MELFCWTLVIRNCLLLYLGVAWVPSNALYLGLTTDDFGWINAQKFLRVRTKNSLEFAHFSDFDFRWSYLYYLLVNGWYLSQFTLINPFQDRLCWAKLAQQNHFKVIIRLDYRYKYFIFLAAIELRSVDSFNLRVWLSWVFRSPRQIFWPRSCLLHHLQEEGLLLFSAWRYVGFVLSRLSSEVEVKPILSWKADWLNLFSSSLEVSVTGIFLKSLDYHWSFDFNGHFVVLFLVYNQA